MRTSILDARFVNRYFSLKSYNKNSERATKKVSLFPLKNGLKINGLEILSEAVIQGYSVKNMFLKISKY